MKRQVITLVLGTVFALPAFANNEIDAGSLPQDVVSTKSRAQVGEELLAAKHSGNWMVNAELGTQSRPTAAAKFDGKSKGEVRAELEQAYRTGEMIVRGEI